VKSRPATAPSIASTPKPCSAKHLLAADADHHLVAGKRDAKMVKASALAAFLLVAGFWLWWTFGSVTI
jgi:hypothetical protein